MSQWTRGTVSGSLAQWELGECFPLSALSLSLFKFISGSSGSSLLHSGFSLFVVSRSCFPVAEHRHLIAVGSLVAKHRLQRLGSVAAVHGRNCSLACGIFPDQGSNLCPLHWQADPYPLHHQGSPALVTSSPSRGCDHSEDRSASHACLQTQHPVGRLTQSRCSTNKEMKESVALGRGGRSRGFSLIPSVEKR